MDKWYFEIRSTSSGTWRRAVRQGDKVLYNPDGTVEDHNLIREAPPVWPGDDKVRQTYGSIGFMA